MSGAANITRIWARIRAPIWLTGIASVLVACGDTTGAEGVAGSGQETETAALSIRVDTGNAIAEVSGGYLSITIDTSRAVSASGTPYDFDRPRLRRMTRELAPGMLRIGGTRADEVFYDLSEAPVEEPPEGYGRVMTRAIWDDICGFATDLDLELLFTLNAGPGPRDANGDWTADNARALLQHARESGCPVSVWELGNEINGFAYAFGPSAYIDGAQYAQDMLTARALVDELTPDLALAGPASAFWPLWGEFSPVLPEFMARGGHLVDVVTWHYYPQQSSSCPIASRPAEVDTLLQPEHLDELLVWADHVEAEAIAYAPEAEVWLGETSHAQCGGQEGLSDRFVTGFWWLDQLGALAQRGQPRVFRQTLTGGIYSLIDEATLEPHPDYFTSLLWRRLMGERVLGALVEGSEEVDADATLVRAYAHCARGGAGAVSLALINLDAARSAPLRFDDALGEAREVYLLTAPDLLNPEIHLNGTRLRVAEDGCPPPMPPVETTGMVRMPPLSYGFVVLPEAHAPTCF